MNNPFEDISGKFFAIINDKGQFSLWPELIKIPDGWETAFGPDQKRACVDYIETRWVDMR